MGVAPERRPDAPKPSDRIRSLLDAASGALDELRFVEEELTADDRAAMAVGLFRLGEQLTATEAGALGRFKYGPVWIEDGFKSAPAWLAHHGNLDQADARRRIRHAAFLSDVPDVADELVAGRIGKSQFETLAGLRTVKRAGVFDRDLSMLMGLASTLSVPDFDKAVAHWRDLADDEIAKQLDGDDVDDTDRSIEKRSVHLSQLGSDGYRLDGNLTNEAGALVARLLEAKTRELFESDWAEAKAIHGDDVSINALKRTASQRRHDAFVELTLNPGGVDLSQVLPVVQVLIDQQTFNDNIPDVVDLDAMIELIRTWEQEDEAVSTSTDGPGSNVPEANGTEPTGTARVADFHPDAERIPPTSELDDGTYIVPRRAVQLAIAGMVQRVMFKGRNTVMDVGQRNRLFTGALRQALIVRDRTCTRPGCCMPAVQCEADHIHPFAEGGTTSERGGHMLCAFHHRQRSRSNPFGVTREIDNQLGVHGSQIIHTKPDGGRLY